MIQSYVKFVLWISLAITLLLLSAGFVVNYFFDLERLNILNDRLSETQLKVESYFLQKSFDASFNSLCSRDEIVINDFKDTLHQFGADLDRYSSKAVFKKSSFDNLVTQFSVIQTEFYLALVESNELCGTNYIPVLFFFSENSDKDFDQSFILTKFSNKHPDNLFVFSFQADEEKKPLINIFSKSFGVNKTPSLIFGDKMISHGEVLDLKFLEKYYDDLHAVDPYSQSYDMEFTAKATGFGAEKIISLLKNASPSENDFFAKADLNLAIGRLTRNSTLICAASELYLLVNGTSEYRALALESAASLRCSSESDLLYQKASALWKDAGFAFRADIDSSLSKGIAPNIPFKEIALYSNISVPDNFGHITIGESYIEINSSDTIATQVDRTLRDWLSGQLDQSPFGDNILTTFSERLSYNASELRSDIGWHEGARLALIQNYTNASYFAATGTVVKKINNNWYATNENGTAMFDVPLDKLLYPTTRFLQDDLAVIVDTHGVNMLVAQSVIKNATVVLSDCDNPGKVKAALYLVSKGIKVICFPDKYLPQALGRSSSILGSPPITLTESRAILGNRSVSFSQSDPIIVVNSTSSRYALWYYQTPASYFSEFEKFVDLNLTFVQLNEFDQLGIAVDLAKQKNASIIAARVFNSADYREISAWLNASKNNNVILFHSTSYPYGLLLANEFQSQVSFDDINPKFT